MISCLGHNGCSVLRDISTISLRSWSTRRRRVNTYSRLYIGYYNTETADCTLLSADSVTCGQLLPKNCYLTKNWQMSGFVFISYKRNLRHSSRKMWYASVTYREVHDPLYHFTTRHIIFVYDVKFDDQFVPLSPIINIRLKNETKKIVYKKEIKPAHSGDASSMIYIHILQCLWCYKCRYYRDVIQQHDELVTCALKKALAGKSWNVPNTAKLKKQD